jgi:L-threonylcarbamoyladenylate synthase
MHNVSIEEAQVILRQGGIIAYPTEAVYGLGCDVFNQAAVEAVRTLKGRADSKSMITLISDWSQLFSLIAPINDEQLERIRKTWPGFVTWVFPSAASLPPWLSSEQNTIAIRMTAHPIAAALSAHMPIISTSANLSGQPPSLNESQLKQQIPQGIDALVNGPLGFYTSPSPIFDIKTGQQLR